MMVKRFAVLALALLPLAASAQAMPVQRLPGPAPGTAAPSTIAVGGRGSARVAVKTVTFVAYVRGPADEPGALAAMRAAGIEEVSIGPVGPQISFNAQGPTALRGTVRDVSAAKLERIGQAAAAYVRAHPGASIDNVMFSPRLDDCAANEQTARTAAIADARRKAQGIAELSGLTIEGVLSVSETGGCPLGNDGPYLSGGNAFDLATLTTTIVVFDNVTFSVVAGSPSTRRRTL
jgi:uncharacterized protein YggE